LALFYFQIWLFSINFLTSGNCSPMPKTLFLQANVVLSSIILKKHSNKQKRNNKKTEKNKKQKRTKNRKKEINAEEKK